VPWHQCPKKKGLEDENILKPLILLVLLAGIELATY
jgi:hypothetical protein